MGNTCSEEFSKVEGTRTGEGESIKLVLASFGVERPMFKSKRMGKTGLEGVVLSVGVEEVSSKGKMSSQKVTSLEKCPHQSFYHTQLFQF